jgi:hypothetical protein
MRTFGFGVIAACGLLAWMSPALATVSADSATPVAASTPAAPTSNPDEVVCKSLPAPTGSRLGVRRECHTQHEWDDIHAQAQKNLDESQMRGMQAGRPNGG